LFAICESKQKETFGVLKAYARLADTSESSERQKKENQHNPKARGHSNYSQITVYRNYHQITVETRQVATEYD